MVPTTSKNMQKWAKFDASTQADKHTSVLKFHQISLLDNKLLGIQNSKLHIYDEKLKMYKAT